MVLAVTASAHPPSPLLNPAGGLRYHWRAFRRRRRWDGFRQQIGRWLGEWSPDATTLLLVGPSAGYCLPFAWLNRFRGIDALEPDPVARLLFSYRFPRLRARLRWHERDYLAPGEDGFAPDRLDALARDFPARAILFCNVLGQIPFLYPDAVDTPSFATWKAHLPQALRRHPWATFHDRLSGPAVPALETPVDVAGSVSDEDLAERFYPASPVLAEVASHLTADLVPEAARRLFAWEIRRGWFHLIEGIVLRAAARRA